MGVGKEKMKKDGIRRETNHKRLLISQNKLRVARGGGYGGGGWIIELGRVCVMVSAVKCINLMIHRPVRPGENNTLYVNVLKSRYSFIQ